MSNTPEQYNATDARPRPGRRWYVLSAAILLLSFGLVFAVVLNTGKNVRDRIEAMPRFVGPTDEGGFVLTIEEPGRYNVFYENLGTLGGRPFDTPRHQVWTDPLATSMACTLTHVETGETVKVRLPEVGGNADKRDVNQDLIFPYNFPGLQGHGVWVFEAEAAGDYRFDLAYKDAVLLDPEDVEIPPELTRSERREMLSEEGEAYDTERRDAIERAALAHVEPVDVLFAVGPDPTQGGYFNLLGVKGAATVLAFGFTASVLITLVTFMLRNGHVTPRGQLADVRRMGD